MMNLDLLFNVAKTTGGNKYKDIAIKHAMTTMHNHFRPDYTCWHVVSYNNDGTVESKQTFQGKNDDSSWARGQAWAIYGYTACYRETNGRIFLNFAKGIADMIMDRVKTDDAIPYWDYDAPVTKETPRDVSAASVTASAMIELSTMASDGQKYLDYAEKILKSLSSDAYLAKVGDNQGFILMHSVGSLPNGSEIDSPLNYADYYYLEALKRFMDLKGISYRYLIHKNYNTYYIMNKILKYIILLAVACFASTGYAQELKGEVFSILNLDYPGLEKVKALHQEGKDEDAAKALLDYYRARTNVKTPDINLNEVTISKKEQKWADDGLKHTFFVHKGYQPSYNYGEDINWQYWPVKDNELRWQLHRHKWFTPMGKAYRVSGDEKYAKEWAYQYIDWIKKNPLVKMDKKGYELANDGEIKGEAENVRFAWRPLEVSNRLQDQTSQFQLFLPSPSFTPDFLTEFLVNYYNHALLITRIKATIYCLKLNA